MVVERTEPFARKTVDGEVQENHFKTVDVDSLTPIGNGQAMLDGQVVTIRGNEITVTYDGNGVPMRYHAKITEQYPNISRARESSERGAQRATARDGRTGIVHDNAPDQSYDGGHAAGHQFFPGLGRDNMFPQESGFNRHVYTQFESEMASWAHAHADVEIDVDLSVTRNGGVTPTQSYDVNGRVVQQVPDRVTINIVCSDGADNPLHYYSKQFDNAPGQSHQAQRPTADDLDQLAGSANDR